MKTCRQCGNEIDIGLDGLCAGCFNLREKPDATSKRKELGGVPFHDMKQIDEQDRFKVIAGHISNNPGKSIAVMVETDKLNKGKGDRYIAGVKALVPGVNVRRVVGIVPLTETLMFKL